MSKVTPPAGAGAERLAVKVKVVVPALPSLSVTSLIVRLGRGLQEFSADELLRGVGAAAVKSAELLSVSAQPFAPRRSAVVVLGAGAFAPPSLQLAVAP